MGIGLGIGVGVGRQRFAGGFADSYSARVLADGGTIEALSCVAGVSTLLQQASLLIVPSGYKAGTAYGVLPNNGNGDLTWSRNSTANRTQSNGTIGSVSANVPRLSYMYGSCPALLLEPQRTNLLVQSEDFSSTSWGKVNISVTANTTTAPDGNTTADLIVENNTANAHAITRPSLGLSSGMYSITIYAKAKERSKLMLYYGGGNKGYGFDLANGTMSSITGITSADSYSITSVGNGWYRCQIGVSSLTVTAFDIYLLTSFSGFTYTGDGTSGLYLWGAQLEAGAYATTYIPTTTATATRLEDIYTHNNIYTNGLISASGGTWFLEFKNNIAYLRDNVNNLLLGTGTSPFSGDGFFIRDFQANSSARLSIGKYIAGGNWNLFLTTTDNVKVAIKWNGSTADIFANGVKVVSATAFTTTLMENLRGSNGVPLFIQQMALFNTPLSDSDCQLLTT